MKNCSSKKGSALIIVLGLLAFMVVSAVAFSSYMRFSRLPSSYLRRTSATRLLAKAALAHAIDDLDYSIANNPYPGIGDHSAGGIKRNYWKNRIFIGTNTFLEAEETIPVLTLEGLAYIPPPLVNEARYFSRRSLAAKWQPFSFDTGRYAFCAIDVSDYFDVNRMSANMARSSADNGIISLAHIFEDYQHKNAPTGADKWDDWMKKFRDEDTESGGYIYKDKVPLVSLADFNLSLYSDGASTGFESPICKYLESNVTKGFDSFNGESEEDKIRNMTFVTDSLFTSNKTKTQENKQGNSSSHETKTFDLRTTEGQPFTMPFLNNQSLNLMQIMASAQPAKAHFLENCYMPVLGLAALYDYLDFDRVPMSLAIPTHEQAPMVCGIKPNFDAAKIKLKGGPNDNKVYNDRDNGAEIHENDQKAGETREAFQTISYYIDPTALMTGFAGGIETLLVYPFAHNDEVTASDSFNVDGRVSLFFTTTADPMKMRTGNDRTGNDKDILHLETPQSLADVGMAADKQGVISIKCNELSNQKFNKTVVDDEREVVKLVHLPTPTANQVGTVFNSVPLLTVTYKWTQTWNSENERYEPWPRPQSAEIVRARTGIPPLLSNGTVDPRFLNDQQLIGILTQGGTTLKLNLALWVRIKQNNGDGKTVDLVPACLYDDQIFINRSNHNLNNAELAKTIAGSPYPLMRFDTGVEIPLEITALEDLKTQQKDITISPEAVMIDDPRFNHAPESWYATTKDKVTVEEWLESITARTRNGGDLFLATSDQGYLQSIYELAFLPMFATHDNFDKKQFNNSQTGDYANPEDGRVSFGQKNHVKNGNLMWQSLKLYGNNANDMEDLEEEFASQGTGFRVNPYTDSTNILMAAFANTPVNWRLASTNDFNESSGLGMGMSVAAFNSKYAWNEYCSDSKFMWKDLQGVAEALMNDMCPNRQPSKFDQPPTDQPAPESWRDAWFDFWENADDDRFGKRKNYQLSNESALWSVDRKYLYGYWSECFSPSKQQLFILFVRSEPLMLGGGEMNKVPPQLSTRAVAVVWRDPNETKSSGGSSKKGSKVDGYPHRTRVLFYKQLD